MNPNHTLIVANWKMQLSFNESIRHVENNRNRLAELGNHPDRQIVLCPSFPALYPIQEIISKTPIHLGAQDCSAFRGGAYTGQVCAESLCQIGCQYCLVGHSERRINNNETEEEIANKVQRLLEQELQPIICIGETLAEYKDMSAVQTLANQLKPIFIRIAQMESSELPIYIAYEPVWAIGSGKTPDTNYLGEIFSFLQQKVTKELGRQRSVGLLYGGSICSTNVSRFKEISAISGFLVGGASLDFQKFYNIVNLL